MEEPAQEDPYMEPAQDCCMTKEKESGLMQAEREFIAEILYTKIKSN